LPGSEGKGGEGRGRGKRGEMTQTLYVHMNKINKRELNYKTLRRKHSYKSL
jgi:hypothetical protein